jgi:hypothetical protein
MQYLLLIYDQESQWGKLSEAEAGKMYQEYGVWLAEISSAESCIDSFLAQAGTLSL